MYHNGVQYTPFPEAQHFSRLDNAYGAYLYGVPHSSQEVEIRQVAKVPLGQQQANNFCQQPETEMRQMPERPVVQFCTGAMPGDSRMLQNFTRMETSAPHAESEPVDMVYHIARDDSSYGEEASNTMELRTKEGLKHDDVSERRHRKERAETDAKAGTTRHSSRHSNGTSTQAADSVNAKVGSTQHSPPKQSNSSSQNVRNRTAYRTSRHKKRPLMSLPRSTSTVDRRRDRKNNASREDEPYSPSDASMDGSSGEEVVPPKHIMKPPKFDGQSSFETFMVQFSNCAEYNQWNEAQKLAHLRNSLEKDAATILWDYGEETTTSWKGLTELLETRFGGKAMSEKYRIELRNRRRKTDETLSSLHADIRRLAALAYNDVTPEMRDQVTCDSFLNALGDPELAFKIRE